MGSRIKIHCIFKELIRYFEKVNSFKLHVFIQRKREGEHMSRSEGSSQ